MSTRVRLRRTVPWVLCGVSLGTLALAIVFRWGSPSADHDLTRLEGTIVALGFTAIPVVGALIAVRLPDNSYGWIWCGLGLACGLAVVGQPLGSAAGWPPWVGGLLAGWGFLGLLGLLFFEILLFPTGRLPTPRWRWIARVVVAGDLAMFLLLSFVHDPSDPTTVTPWALQGAVGDRLSRAAVVTVGGLFALVVVATFSLVQRFRRADPVERRQLTWFTYAAVLNGALIVLGPLGLLPTGPASTTLTSAGFLLLPVAVGAAMLRYRLFEIDRIISRTVSYGLLTALLVGLYLLVVALLRPLLEPLTGSSALAVAGSTLAVAAVFNPARRRLQAAVDRRFDRAHYDAGRAVEAFAARLREQVDLDEIAGGLRATVAATVAPDRMAVWRRAPGRPGGSAR